MPEKYIKAADCKKYFYEHLDDVHIAGAMNAIDEMPAADVAPVRHGQWVKEKRDVLIHWHCSACKECYYLDMPNAEYCPHCGAKMDERSVMKMTERERLIKLLMQGELEAEKQGVFNCSRSEWKAEIIADYLLANGVRVPPVKAEEAENALKERENNA